MRWPVRGMNAGETADFPQSRDEQRRSQSWKNVLTGAKLAIGVVFFIVVLRQVDVAGVAALLKRCDLAMFGEACLLLAAAVAVNALRWREITRHILPTISVRDAMIGSFEAIFFNQLLPTNIGGDAVKSLRAFDAGATTGDAVLGVLIDRAFGLWFVAVSLLAVWLVGRSPLIATQPFQIVGVASAVIALGAVGAVIAGVLAQHVDLPGWMRPLVTLTRSFAAIVFLSERMLPICSCLVIANALTTMSFLMCCRSLGIQIGFWDAGILLQGMVLASMIPVSGSDRPSIPIAASAFSLSILWAPQIAAMLVVMLTCCVVLAVAFSPTHLKCAPICALSIILVPTDAEVFVVSSYAFWWAGILVFLALFWDTRRGRDWLRLTVRRSWRRP